MQEINSCSLVQNRINVMKRVSILQSNYIPWKGYFDIINYSDTFIFYDEVQYTSGDWRNRNLIKTAQGLKWLTIPVENKGRLDRIQKINETRISDSRWALKHWKSIEQNYSKAHFFHELKPVIHPLYTQCAKLDLLCDVNYLFCLAISSLLGMKTDFAYSKNFDLCEDRNQRLVQMVLDAGGTHYLSGASAKSYLNEELFHQAGITVEWMDYSAYPQYGQLNPPFEHGVTILDLLFNQGIQSARDHMKSFSGRMV